MNFDQLKAFHRVALTGSFTKAARLLHITQPAVSKQVQLLEYSLGITLFDRQGRKVRLTNEGKTLLSYTDRLFDLYGEILAIFESEKSMEHGKIAIGSSNVMGTYYLPKIIRLYNNQYPGIEIDLRLGNSDYVIDKILEGEVDIGISGKAGAHPKLSKQLIHKERLLLISSVDHDLAKREFIEADDLLKASFICRERGTSNRAAMDKFFKKKFDKKYPKISLEIENVEAVKQIVQHGYGITIIPEVTVRREIESGILKKLQFPELDLSVDIYMVYVKNKVFPKAVRTFLEILAGSGIFSSAEDLLEKIFTE